MNAFCDTREITEKAKILEFKIPLVKIFILKLTVLTI